jgi:hypothetical protein
MKGSRDSHNRVPLHFCTQSYISHSIHQSLLVLSEALQLGYTERLTYHHCRPHTEYEAHDMKITVSSRFSPHGHNPTRKPLLPLDPTVLDPVREEPDQRQGGRDGQSLEIVCLSRAVLGYECHSGIEPGETGESAADKAG